MISPIANARDSESALPRALGRQSSAFATSTMRRRVASLTPGRPLSATETAPLETPAWRATSAIVGRRPEGSRGDGRVNVRHSRRRPPGKAAATSSKTGLAEILATEIGTRRTSTETVRGLTALEIGLVVISCKRRLAFVEGVVRQASVESLQYAFCAEIMGLFDLAPKFRAASGKSGLTCRPGPNSLTAQALTLEWRSHQGRVNR